MVCGIKLMPKQDSLINIWCRSPEEALQEAFRRSSVTSPAYHFGAIFIWTTVWGEDGTSYGSYKYVQQKELIGRRYKVEIADYNVSIRYLDAVHLYVPGKGFRTVLYPTNG